MRKSLTRWKQPRKEDKAAPKESEKHPAQSLDGRAPASPKTSNSNARLPLSMTLSADTTFEINPVIMKLTVTNNSDQRIAPASFMKSSVLVFDGVACPLQKLFHDRWDEIATIRPGQKIALTTYSHWYGIRDTVSMSKYQDQIGWRRKLEIGVHTIRLRAAGQETNAVQVEVLADT